MILSGGWEYSNGDLQNVMGVLGEKQIYAKQHLVIFGEYIPFQEWIPLKPIVEFTGFKAGDGLQVFETPEGLRYSPLVCYEIIFPGKTIARGSAPDFIVNVTNDAWYGDSAGPHQHLVQSTFRAIETGIPVIRVANTGFSSLINAMGAEEYRSDLFIQHSQTLRLPRKI